MSSIRQVVHTKFNRPDVSLHGLDDQASYMEIACTVQPSGHQPSGSGRSTPYYGNYVQPKCNRPNTRATPSERGLVMEAFSATLERRLQLTIRSLGQAIRTPSGILDITFYSNIGLGRTRCRWKANKNAVNWWSGQPLESSEQSSSGRPPRKFENFSELLSRQGNSCPSGRPRLPSRRACQRLHFLPELGLLKPINKGF